MALKKFEYDIQNYSELVCSETNIGVRSTPLLDISSSRARVQIASPYSHPFSVSNKPITPVGFSNSTTLFIHVFTTPLAPKPPTLGYVLAQFINTPQPYSYLPPPGSTFSLLGNGLPLFPPVARHAPLSSLHRDNPSPF